MRNDLGKLSGLSGGTLSITTIIIRNILANGNILFLIENNILSVAIMIIYLYYDTSGRSRLRVPH